MDLKCKSNQIEQTIEFKSSENKETGNGKCQKLEVKLNAISTTSIDTTPSTQSTPLAQIDQSKDVYIYKDVNYII